MALEDNCVFYSDLDGNANDKSGNNNNLVVSGATFVAGLKDQALDFDENDDNAKLASTTGLPTGDSDFAAQSWVYPDNTAGVQHLVTWGGVTTNTMVMAKWTDHSIYWAKFGIVFNGNTAMIANSWNHVVCMHDSVNQLIYIFLNGKLDKVSARTFTPSPANLNLILGERWDGVGDYGGRLDMPAIWTRTLTFGSVSQGQTAGGEISELYNGGAGKKLFVSGTRRRRIILDRKRYGV